MTPLISLQSDILQYQGVKLQNPHHITIPQGTVAVMGPNGAGKSTLGKILEKGWNVCTNQIKGCRDHLTIKSIEFSDIHSLAGFKVEYYQQRFESTMNDDVPTVAELFGSRISSPQWTHLSSLLKLDGVENKKVNFLSSGELRKLLIINLLFDLPDVLILDNSYIGLDAESREILNETIALITSQGMTVILLLCNPIDLPPFTDAVIPMHNLVIDKPILRTGTIEALRQSVESLFDYSIDLDNIPPQLESFSDNPADVIFALSHCKVRYGTHLILDDVSWTVHNGECWALAGPNGSGKSTLLSLVCADNPQGYSNDITIFGNRRGSGESIWDIKRHIGYISPEMHLYFNGSGNVTTIIAQGLNDTVGLYKRVKPEQMEQALVWMELFHLEHLADRMFNTLSAGEQRLVLLARTFIKNPQLLILDEPLHGLDVARKRSIRSVVNHLVARDGLTLIYVTHYLPEIPECVTHTKTLSRRI